MFDSVTARAPYYMALNLLRIARNDYIGRDYGGRLALDKMGVPAGHALYVGNDMHRDIFGAREAGLRTVMFDSDQGTKAHLDCVPDDTITDFRDLLAILGLPGL
jgi:HAD-hyrolase-like